MVKTEAAEDIGHLVPGMPQAQKMPDPTFPTIQLDIFFHYTPTAW